MAAGSECFTRALVACAWIVHALVAVALGAGLLPGKDVYTDQHDCFGEALGRLFAFEHGSRGSCEPRYVLEHTERAADWTLWALLVPIAIGGWLVRRRPRVLYAIAWPLASAALAVGVLVATFDLDLEFGTRTIARWPTFVVSGAIAGIAAVLASVLLVGTTAGIRRVLRDRRDRREAQPVFPTAVVLDRPSAGSRGRAGE